MVKSCSRLEIPGECEAALWAKHGSSKSELAARVTGKCVQLDPGLALWRDLDAPRNREAQVVYGAYRWLNDIAADELVAKA